MERRELRELKDPPENQVKAALLELMEHPVEMA